MARRLRKLISRTRLFGTLRRFVESGSSGGLVLMAVAIVAPIVANSPLQGAYFGLLKTYVGGLSVLHWINDGLMAVFFLLVGLEIKREVVQGELSTGPSRVLPGATALGGMIVPALVYVAFNTGSAETLPGWAIPAATDIAFALAVLSLFGSRVPASLKILLTALAIIDDLGAVVIIALFYTAGLKLYALLGALAVTGVLIGLNRFGVRSLIPYLLLGLALWWLVLMSGVHATLAGVILAMTIPLDDGPEAEEAPLLRLEHAIQPWVAFLVVPIFGFANAGVSLAGFSFASLANPVPLGVAAGLFLGKQVGVLGMALLTIKAGWATMPDRASWWQLYGVALLCGIGFTMSLFIGLLAFPASEALQDQVKIGVLAGSVLSGLAGALVLALAPKGKREA